MTNGKSVTTENQLSKSTKAVLLGTIMGTFFSIVILVVSSFLFVKSQNIPTSVVTPLTMFIIALGAFISGYVSARILRNNGLFWGIISGFIMFIVVFISGLMISGGEISTLSLVKLTLMLLMGAIGGITGVNKKVKR